MIFFQFIEQFIINLANTLWNGPILITVLLMDSSLSVSTGLKADKAVTIDDSVAIG